MDILDEIDAAIYEKRSKWKYTPMREKNETDAIIDELLLEFSPSNSSRNKSVRQPYSAPKPVQQRNAAPVKTKTPILTEKNVSKTVADEQRERLEYEAAVRRENNISRLKSSEENFYIPPVENRNEKYKEEFPSDEEYDQEYTSDDEYDEEYDDEYDDDYSENIGHGNSSGGDFNQFMDSENEGERGDIPKLSVSNLSKTIIKILVLAVFGAFAVVGIINTVSNVASKYGSSSSSSKTDTKKKELQSVIYPLIVTEIEDFDDPSKLKDEDLINIALWELVINADKTVFKDTDSGEILLPQDQMTYIVQKLFGEDIKLNHTTAGIGNTAITYDEKNKQYIILDDTDIYSYYPVVTDISDIDDTYTVYADCYRSSPSWKSGKSDPSKRVMITIKKTSNYYNIISLKTIPIE